MPLNRLAWNNKIGLWSYFVGLRAGEMTNRDSWGYSYSIVRGGKYFNLISELFNGDWDSKTW